MIIIMPLPCKTDSHGFGYTGSPDGMERYGKSAGTQNRASLLMELEDQARRGRPSQSTSRQGGWLLLE